MTSVGVSPCFIGSSSPDLALLIQQEHTSDRNRGVCGSTSSTSPGGHGPLSPERTLKHTLVWHLLRIGTVTLQSLLGPAITDVLSEVLSPSLHPWESSSRRSRETERKSVLFQFNRPVDPSIHTHTLYRTMLKQTRVTILRFFVCVCIC